MDGSGQSSGPGALRLGLVGPLPPPSGGMPNQTLQLQVLLRNEGVEVEMVRMNAPYKPEWAGRIKGVRALFRLVPYLAHLWSAAGRVDVFHVMANSGWSWHLFAAPAIWIGHLRGTPVVVNYRGGEAESFFRKAQKVVGFSLKRVDRTIVPSGFLQDVFGRFGFVCEIVPNIVNLERFNPVPLRAGAIEPHILIARNLEPIYDNATAIRALPLVRERCPQARMTVAGSGPLRAELEQLAAELGLKDVVTFTGRVDNAGMAALYQAADVMVNPTLIDNTPNSVLESLACGVPVVSTRVGGVPYIVQDGETALLVPPQDPRAMADAIVRVAQDRALAARLRENGLRHVQQFTWTNVKPRLLGVYHSVIRPRAAKAATTP
ncbi:glycosyltransferase family 1 protein [Massilia arenosa]|uniref:Glycosyltransferase family 1 protein n=1 Tax=Zemynaea arenosa TaxID=2561931 RepID=A0A4Y9SY66_9BURK|nr:glycosyltransferase family 4 protein [Massilia arenosa]TFW29676.1 glycosyltransferase family 1 protein [Massilia arenosa]